MFVDEPTKVISFCYCCLGFLHRSFFFVNAILLPSVNYKFFQDSSNLIYTTFSSYIFISPNKIYFQSQQTIFQFLAFNLKLMIIHFYCSLTISFRSTQRDTIFLCFGMLLEFMRCCQRSSSFFIASFHKKTEAERKKCYYKTKIEVLFSVRVSRFIFEWKRNIKG